LIDCDLLSFCLTTLCQTDDMHGTTSDSTPLLKYVVDHGSFSEVSNRNHENDFVSTLY